MSRIEKLKDRLTYLGNAMEAMAFDQKPKAHPSDKYITYVVTAAWEAHLDRTRRSSGLAEVYGPEEAAEVWAELWDIALISLGTGALPGRVIKYVLRRFPELTEDVAKEVLVALVTMVSPVELFEAYEADLRELEAAA